MSQEQLFAIAAVFSGISSSISGWFSYRIAKKRCDERVAELHAEYDRGLNLGMRIEEWREKHEPPSSSTP